MANLNTNIIHKSKELVSHLRDNEAKYISGELDLNSTLKRTEELFNLASSGKTSASGVLQDSSLMQLQSKIAKECVRTYQVDTLVFDPRKFCEKVKNFYFPSDVSDNNNASTSSRRNTFQSVWEKLGERCKNIENTVPPFSFIHGTLDADSIEPRKPIKPKLPRIEDEEPEKTTPEAVIPGSQNEQDVMLKDANRVYTIFCKLIDKSKKQALCFYEFVTDPNSFTRTVENIFLVSLLVKEGHVCIVPDKIGLPCMKKVSPPEKQAWDKESMQSVLSIDIDDWKNIVKTFKFETPLIPPRQTQTVAGVSQNK